MKCHLLFCTQKLRLLNYLLWNRSVEQLIHWHVLLIVSLVHLISKIYLLCSYGSEESPVTDLQQLPFCQVIIYNKIRVVIWFPLLLQVTVCVRKLTCVCIISAFICMCGWWWDSSNRVGQGMPDFLFDLLWFHAMDDLFNTALTVGIHWSISFMICGGCIFFFFWHFQCSEGKHISVLLC